MAILHGSWLLQSSTLPLESEIGQGCLLIWGETWRRLTPEETGESLKGDRPIDLPDTVLCHPFAMSGEELVEFLQSLQQSNPINLPLGEWSTGGLPSRDRGQAVAVAAGASSRAGTRSRQSAAAAPTVTPPTHSPLPWQSAVLALPTQTAEAGGWVPLHSAAPPDQPESLVLHPWQVQGLCLPATVALPFLNSLPLSSVTAEDSFLGNDLRFWSHVARWSLDLLARMKFLPGLESRSSTEALAQWQVLLDSAVDRTRLEHFTQQMPPACRTYRSLPPQDAAPPLAIDLPAAPPELLQSFLNQILDAQVRTIAEKHASPQNRGTGAGTIDPPLRDWLRALGTPSGSLDGTVAEPLQTALTTWIAPLQSQWEQALFRTCFQLHPPQYGASYWTLAYCLQAVDNDQFLVDANTIWSNPVERLNYRGRTIHRPQETLLAGLGLASRLYGVIEPSLQEQRPQSCTLNPMQAYEFIKTTAWRFQDSGLGVVLPESLSSQGGWANRLGLRIQAQTGKAKKAERLGLQSLLNFRWELTIGGQSLTKEEFDRLVALNTPLVQINDEWVELRPQDIRAAQSFFASRKDQTTLSLEDALRISTGDTQMIEKLPVVSFEASGSLHDLINTLTGNRTIAPIPTPESFRGELRPYQARGVGWLAFLEQWGLGACLADDMGLGKTIQLIAFLLHLKEQNTLGKPTLLVCPTSVLGNWEREVKKFAPSLTQHVHHGEKRPKGKNFARAVQDKHLVITSYALVQRDLKDLQTVSWQGMVLDEAQNIKNPDAKQSQAVRQLEAEFRIALTGTPVENRLSELWSILDFLNPNYLGPKNFFQRRFAIPIERYGDTTSLQTLRSLVQPFILRRLKTDKTIIQDLPEKQEMPVFCGLTSEQASLYQNLVEKSLADIEAADGIQRKGIILALLVKLKQICNHPQLFAREENGGKDTRVDDAFSSRSGKVQRLGEMLEEALAEGDRALIFTQFAEWGKLLKTHLERQLGREVLFLYGGTSKKQREEMVDRFQQDPRGPRLFILSLKAGGVGLNLTRANHVFHFDRWWNPAVENQATDRVFRIGQTRNVQVHKFVCTGTLEEKIHDLIESKKALAEQVVGTGENWLTELDTNSLRDLLLLDRTAVIGEE